jgi:hypothetical protein
MSHQMPGAWRKLGLGAIVVYWFFAPSLAWAELTLFEDERWLFTFSPSERTDVVMLKNTVDLDSEQSDDSTTYLGFDYSLGFNMAAKADGPQAFLRFERNGPYDYDAPLWVHNTLYTSTARMDRYHDSELLPQLEEFWIDVPLGGLPVRLQSGLFTYEVGHGLSLGGAYENYGTSLTLQHDPFIWRLYHAFPDAVHKPHLGPHIQQETDQGIEYSHGKTQFLSTDLSFQAREGNTIQLYTGALLDRTGDKRSNTFSNTPKRDFLGTVGIAWDVEWRKFAFNLEAARNFGESHSADHSIKDVEHKGYMFYGETSYTAQPLKPHTRFLYASGNTVTREMVTNGDTKLASGSNRAFSVFSPLNTNLSDSIYPSFGNVPLVAMGNGYGLNYGVNRPTTVEDPRAIENLILVNLGTDLALTDRVSVAFDWWYLNSPEPGFGTLNGETRRLSHDLGHELDLSCEVTLNDHLALSLASGYFFPGDYYGELRDDGGTPFSPFIRGDGKPDRAYQIELSLAVQF